MEGVTGNNPLVGSGTGRIVTSGTNSFKNKLSDSLSIADAPSGADSDAVRLSLEGTSNRRKVAATDLNTARRAGDSFAVGSLRTIRRVASSIVALQEELKDTNGMMPAQKEAKGKELNGLKDEYNRIVQSKEFDKLVEVTSAVTSMVRAKIGSHASTAPIADALNTHGGLVGVEFIELVRQGKLDDLQSLTDSFAAFQQGIADPESTDGKGLKSYEDIIKRADKALALYGEYPSIDEILIARAEETEQLLKQGGEKDSDPLLDKMLSIANKMQQKAAADSTQLLQAHTIHPGNVNPDIL